MITRWTPEVVKAEVVKNLISNGEIVGKFLEADAQRRIMAIKDPEWGKGYRQKLVARLIRNLVEHTGNEVVITVGVAESSSRRGVASRKHGLYIELGSKEAPPHPFLRPAVFENARKIVGLLEGG